MKEAKLRWGAGLIALGIALVVLYEVLKAADVGGIGAPGDIGGGLIPLAGYIAALAGLIVTIRGLVDRRRRRHQ